MVRKIEHHSGLIEYKNIFGQLHRKDGPAIIYPSGELLWFKYGKLHREDGPAIFDSDGKLGWCKKGKLHRKDGPAVIYPSGEVFWYLNHTPYTFKEWIELADISNELKIELVLKYG